MWKCSRVWAVLVYFVYSAAAAESEAELSPASASGSSADAAGSSADAAGSSADASGSSAGTSAGASVVGGNWQVPSFYK